MCSGKNCTFVIFEPADRSTARLNSWTSSAFILHQRSTKSCEIVNSFLCADDKNLVYRKNHDELF